MATTDARDRIRRENTGAAIALAVKVPKGRLGEIMAKTEDLGARLPSTLNKGRSLSVVSRTVI